MFVYSICKIYNKQQTALTNLIEVAVIFKNMSTMKKHIGVDCIDGEYAFLHDINILLNASNNIEYGNKIYIDEKQSEQIAQKAVKDIIRMRMKKGHYNEKKWLQNYFISHYSTRCKSSKFWTNDWKNFRQNR